MKKNPNKKMQNYPPTKISELFGHKTGKPIGCHKGVVINQQKLRDKTKNGFKLIFGCLIHPDLSGFAWLG